MPGTDLRKVDTNPDYWYPLARSRALRKARPLAVSFAGEPIVLVRSASGSVFALEDRCAHRQVPLSGGLVSGETLRCGYHGWTYDKTGSCVDVPYLSKDRSRPHGVRAYPCREAYGLVFVFPGDAAKEPTVPFPSAPAALDRGYKVRYLDRVIRCHYTFMHENLMDMNHQFLHRRLMGNIRPTLLGLDRGEGWFEARYTFDRIGGGGSLGEKLMLGTSPASEQRDVMTIRTQYPYQTLTYRRAAGAKPALDLWLAYVPVDREERLTHSFGLMCIRKPPVPGLIQLFWPFIVYFTEGIFSEDQWIMEEEQKAHDTQGADWNQEPFPVILGLREVLASRGVAHPPG